jgi:hypothetical protein
MLVLVPRFGIAGAGAALLCSTIARLIFVVTSFPLFLKMRVPHLLPKVEDLRFAADAIANWLNQSRRAALVGAEGAD